MWKTFEITEVLFTVRQRIWEAGDFSVCSSFNRIAAFEKHLRYSRDSCSCPLMAVFQVQASSCQLGGRSISWPECEPTAAGACPLQAWLPRRSVYPRKAYYCGAAIGIAWPELSPLGNTMIYKSECNTKSTSVFFSCWTWISFTSPWTCSAWLSRQTGNGLC